jgi:hypothetical protein
MATRWYTLQVYSLLFPDSLLITAMSTSQQFVIPTHILIHRPLYRLMQQIRRQSFAYPFAVPNVLRSVPQM